LKRWTIPRRRTCEPTSTLQVERQIARKVRGTAGIARRVRVRLFLRIDDWRVEKWAGRVWRRDIAGLRFGAGGGGVRYLDDK